MVGWLVDVVTVQLYTQSKPRLRKFAPKQEFEIGLKIPEGDHVYQKQVSAIHIHTRLVTSTTKPSVNSHWSLFLDESGLRSQQTCNIYGSVSYSQKFVIAQY